jgi:hypothetical protein
VYVSHVNLIEELGTTFFPTEAWGQPLTFDIATGGLHHPALLHTALHAQPMVNCSIVIALSNIGDEEHIHTYIHTPC